MCFISFHVLTWKQELTSISEIVVARLWFNLLILCFTSQDLTSKDLLRGQETLIFVPSDCKSGLLQSLDLSSLPNSKANSGECLYIFLIYYFYHLRCLFNDFYGLYTLVTSCWSSVFIRRIMHKFLNVCTFDYTAFAD